MAALNFFTQLKNQRNLSTSESTLVEYILNNPEAVLSMNAKKLAECSFVSQSTVYRLCDKLELTGFSEMKICISNSLKELHNTEPFDYDFPVQENDSTSKIAQKLKENYENTLHSTYDLLDPSMIQRIVKKMKNSTCIDVYTSAGNIFFAENFMFQMKEIGQQVNVPVDEYLQRLQAAQSNAQHFAIVISFSGRGIVSSHIRKTLKNTNTPTLLICSSEYDASLIKPDYILYLSPKENHYKKISSFSTRLSLLYILDILYTCYFEMDYKKNLEKKLKYYDSLRGEKPV